MREIKQEKAFRRDFKQRIRGIHRILLMPDGEFWYVVDKLANDEPLEVKYQDHPLRGKHEGKRECHIKPDLLLVYKYAGDDMLKLERLGSHAELFGL